jgi:hypothetical protein
MILLGKTRRILPRPGAVELVLEAGFLYKGGSDSDI